MSIAVRDQVSRGGCLELLFGFRKLAEREIDSRRSFVLRQLLVTIPENECRNSQLAKDHIWTIEVRFAFGRQNRDPRRFEAHTQHSCRRCERSEEHTSELQSLMRISYAVFCLKKKKKIIKHKINSTNISQQ